MHLLAIIARGDNYTRGVEFYADLQEVCDGQNESPSFASTKEGTSNEEESLSSPTEDTMEFSKGDNIICKMMTNDTKSL